MRTRKYPKYIQAQDTRWQHLAKNPQEVLLASWVDQVPEWWNLPCWYCELPITKEALTYRILEIGEPLRADYSVPDSLKVTVCRDTDACNLRGAFL